jgi:spore coat protein CotH
MKLAAAAPAVAMCLLAACGTAVEQPSGPSATASPGPALSVFDPGRLHDVRIDIDPADWRALQENFRENDYYAADITLDGARLAQVGIRSRGTGSRNPAKPGLRVDFNRYVPAQEYGVYKSLVLDNLFQDASCLRERLAFAVFEAMGIPAPRNAFARFHVNGAYWGLYQVTEPVSKPFLKERLGDESGNLFDYQYAFRWDFSFRGGDPAAYVPVPFEPQTNEDHLDASGLVEFVRAINETPEPGFARSMEAWLEVQRLVTYVAVENAVTEWDGFVGEEGTNNFYLYQYGGQRRFVFIPWDKDTSFRDATRPVSWRLETNVLTRRLFADPGVQQAYAEALRRAVTAYVNLRWLGPRLDQAYAQIRESVLQDPNKPMSDEEFEGAVGGLRGLIAQREQDILGQLGP